VIDNLLKLRPLAVLLVLIGYALDILVSLIQMISYGVRSDFLTAMNAYGGSFVSWLFPVVLGVLLVVSAVVKPEVPRLRTFALVALILTVVSVGLGLLFSLIGVFDDGIGSNLLQFVGTLALATITVVAFLVILRVFSAQSKPAASQGYGQPGQQVGPGQGGPIGVGQWGQQGQPGQQSQPGQSGQQGQPGQQGQQPVWQPDHATGASWGTAQDAAAGTAGTWGGQGQSGWQPQQQPWPGNQPQSQSSAGYPQTQPSAGYPQSQASSSQPEQPSWEDDVDDRTRLTPRVDIQPQDPQQQPTQQQPTQQQPTQQQPTQQQPTQQQPTQQQPTQEPQQWGQPAQQPGQPAQQPGQPAQQPGQPGPGNEQRPW